MVNMMTNVTSILRALSLLPRIVICLIIVYAFPEYRKEKGAQPSLTLCGDARDCGLQDMPAHKAAA